MKKAFQSSYSEHFLDLFLEARKQRVCCSNPESTAKTIWKMAIRDVLFSTDYAVERNFEYVIHQNCLIILIFCMGMTFSWFQMLFRVFCIVYVQHVQQC